MYSVGEPAQGRVRSWRLVQAEAQVMRSAGLVHVVEASLYATAHSMRDREEQLSRQEGHFLDSYLPGSPNWDTDIHRRPWVRLGWGGMQPPGEKIREQDTSSFS